ncbi:peptidoglycan metallopeptidase Pgp3 [Helicobacter didelphidarum]|uniref:M23 family metallopeptidase n=1 Tax=Helicobacter didelphidarum TaxID=2040648 RepID=UPI001FE3762D|nr:M23 family metallopeptidase [Helicobacter didelphidarum]
MFYRKIFLFYCLFYHYLQADSIYFPQDFSAIKKDNFESQFQINIDSSIYQTKAQQIGPTTVESTIQKDIKDSVVTTSQIPIIPNGTVFIAITNEKNPEKLHIGKKTFEWLKHPVDSTKKIAFVGINYYAKPNVIFLNNTIQIRIIQGNYRREKITIKDTSKTKPNKATSDRIASELKEVNRIYTTYEKNRYWNKPFGYPLKNMNITSPYGSARVFNDEVKSYHGGTDLRASIGTSIYAINDGVVVIAKDRFLAGKSVVISHGQGIFSMYYHCSDIKVRVGQKVKQGELIALSGDTGRVSAPHLHFGMLVNGVQIDAMRFINDINKLFEK